MRAKSCGAVVIVGAGAFFVAAAQQAHAISGHPPSQLYGKSISIRWSEDRDGRSVSGELQHRSLQQTIVIYISTQGRAFLRDSRALEPGQAQRMAPAIVRPNTTAGSSYGPSGDVIKTSNTRYSNNFQFQGRTIVGMAAFESGARRTVVSFDEAFRTCTVEVTYGKESGAPGIVAHGFNAQLHLWNSVKVSGQSCAMTDGNLLGEGN